IHFITSQLLVGHRGQVSHYALDYILEELGRPNSEECGCQLRTSYGLTCSHELLFYDIQGQSIPIERVDIFWRTLYVPWPVTPEDDLNYPHRQQTSQFVPLVADPSRRSYSKPTKVPDLNQEPARHSSYVRQMTQSNNLIDYIPEVFRPHIFRINNVEGDGNCGFRSVAVGIDLRENMWPAIRQNLLQALDNYETLFTEMWLSDGFQRIRYTVDHFGLGIAPRGKWMCMPDTGLVIASLYNQPVIFISPKQSNTCFLLWHSPDRP
ncbi:hypothetical protein Tco_0586553, partial [Tanacetum coccineum]